MGLPDGVVQRLIFLVTRVAHFLLRIIPNELEQVDTMFASKRANIFDLNLISCTIIAALGELAHAIPVRFSLTNGISKSDRISQGPQSAKTVVESIS